MTTSAPALDVFRAKHAALIQRRKLGFDASDPWINIGAVNCFKGNTQKIWRLFKAKSQGN
jgi:hypothetical protein